MYGAFGGLQTSGLEAGGLDHARSRLLDDRVITEGGETAALKAKKEILDLLQAAMGENLTNTSVNAGLDEDHESTRTYMDDNPVRTNPLVFDLWSLLCVTQTTIARAYIYKEQKMHPC